MNVLYGETDKVQHSNNEYTDNANWWAKTTGWLRTDTPQTEVEEETAQHLPDGLLGVGTAAAAIIADGITIANGTNTAICIPGLLAEIGSAIRAFSNISATCNSDDMVQCEKIKKTLKYLADLVASLIGAIAYALSMSGNNDALSMFMCEVIIRGVRFLFSVVNTLYVLCCRHTDQADVPEIPQE